MAILAVQVPTLAGFVLTPVAAAGGGDSFPNTGKEFFYVKNADVASKTLTFDSPGTCSFDAAAAAAHDAVVVVATVTERIIGPFPPARFNDGNGRVQVTYSAVTSVTVAVLAAA